MRLPGGSAALPEADRDGTGWHPLTEKCQQESPVQRPFGGKFHQGISLHHQINKQSLEQLRIYRFAQNDLKPRSIRKEGQRLLVGIDPRLTTLQQGHKT